MTKYEAPPTLQLSVTGWPALMAVGFAVQAENAGVRDDAAAAK